MNGDLDRREFLQMTGAGVGATIFGAYELAGCSGVGMENEAAGSAVRTNTAISKENSKSGSSDWAPRHNSGGEAAPVQGYTTRESVAQGNTLAFCVSSEQDYRIEIYRLGWYNGTGGRHLTTLDNTNPSDQPKPEPEGSRKLVTCSWDITDTVEVGSDWVSGLYFARFIPADEGDITSYPFIVKENTPDAHAVVQLPMNTHAAYNGWGGASLYNHTTDDRFDSPGDAVSFDRPYGMPFRNHLSYAIHLVRWMEMEGYDVSYIVNTDMDRDPDLIANYELAICAGHSEFWSVRQFKSFENARDGGTNLAFMGGNIGMWSVNFREDGLRSYNCDKDDSSLMFRNRYKPEAELTGLLGSGAGLWKLPDLTVDESTLDHRWMNGTGFEPGDKVIGVVGHEWDFLADSSPDNVERYFYYEEGTSQWDDLVGDDPADVVGYKAESGATVFHCSTLGYPYQLDPDPTWNIHWPFSRVREYKPSVTKPNAKLQQFQRNVFDDLMT
jgi:hypothetical protein